MIFGASRPRRPRNANRRERIPSRETEVPADLPPKLVPSIRQLVATGIALVHTRLALATIELEEELQRLLGACVLDVVSMLLL